MAKPTIKNGASGGLLDANQEIGGPGFTPA
jgi:hypothetical protein